MSRRSLQTKTCSNDNVRILRKRRRESPHFQQIATTSDPVLTKINTAQLRSHINLYRKLFFEKKITAENAWNVKIIDYINDFVSNNLIDSDTMLIVATTLDICIKVVEYKVEYLENEIKRLAANIEEPIAKRTATEYIQNSRGFRRKSKEAKRSSPRRTKIVQNVETLLLTKVPKMPSVRFIENLDLYASNFDNLSTTKTLTNYGAHKVQLLNDVDCGFVSYNEIDPTVQINLFPKTCLSIASASILICPDLHSFDIYENHIDYDKTLVNKLGKHSQNNEILLGRSAHSTSDIATDIGSNDVDNNEVKGEEIKSLCPIDNTSLFPSNMYLDARRTAPSHWKNKLVRPSDTSFTANVDKATKEATPHKRRRKMMTDKTGPVKLSGTISNNVNFKRKSRKKSKQFNINKCTLCPKILDISDTLNFETTMLNVVTRNDRLYGGCGHLETTTSYSLNEVAETCVSYSRYAKNINMGQLKHIFLECLLEGNKPTCTNYNKKILFTSTKLSNIKQQLVEKLPVEMKSEVSLAVVFFTLLSLATEQSLTIRGCSDLSDVCINK